MEYPPFTSKETGDWGLPASAGFEGGQQKVEDIHPTVPNPYNLLSTLPPSHVWYTVLDLKDAFFCLRLHPESQPPFAFEWKDPDLGLSG